MTKVFERETCSRCGGTGNYSFNLIDGTRCFKCRGNKEVLTKRGRVAYDWYLSHLNIKAGEVNEGMRVKWIGGEKFTVKAIEAPKVMGKSLQSDGTWKEYLGVTFLSASDNRYSCTVETELTRIPLVEEQAKLFEMAKEYQETLTKAGTPRKR